MVDMCGIIVNVVGKPTFGVDDLKEEQRKECESPGPTVIITTNLPFSEWTHVIPNARLCKALLDRITDLFLGRTPAWTESIHGCSASPLLPGRSWPLARFRVSPIMTVARTDPGETSAKGRISGKNEAAGAAVAAFLAGE